MSQVSDSKPRSIDSATLEALHTQLGRSFLKKGTSERNTASLAIAPHGKYASGIFESRTHLLDITSEHASLAIATASGDPLVREVVSLYPYEFVLDPIVVKILADHTRRTGVEILYTVCDAHGKIRYQGHPAKAGGYDPKPFPITAIREWKKNACVSPLRLSENILEQMHAAAENGMTRHFGTSNTPTRYGAAVTTENNMYGAGVYSSFDHRLNLHAEMVAAMLAIQAGDTPITRVGIVSDKFVDTPTPMCGCCRQFFSELENHSQVPLQVIGYAYEKSTPSISSLAELLPDAWNSKR